MMFSRRKIEADGGERGGGMDGRGIGDPPISRVGLLAAWRPEPVQRRRPQFGLCPVAVSVRGRDKVPGGHLISHHSATGP